MACIKYICTFAVLFACSNGNVIRLDRLMNENGMKLYEEGEDNGFFQGNVLIKDNEVNDDNSFIHLIESSRLVLKDAKSNGIGSLHQHNQLTFVKHFARHGLCRNNKGKQRFYTALKSKLCHTKGTFIFQLVEDLCGELERCKNAEKGRSQSTECGNSLYNWVSELFDLNGDGHVDHFERHFYEYETDK